MNLFQAILVTVVFLLFAVFGTYCFVFRIKKKVLLDYIAVGWLMGIVFLAIFSVWNIV